MAKSKWQTYPEIRAERERTSSAVLQNRLTRAEQKVVDKDQYIAALEAEREAFHRLIAGIKPVFALLSETCNEMHNGKINGATAPNICTGDLRARSSEFVRVTADVRPLLVELRIL